MIRVSAEAAYEPTLTALVEHPGSNQPVHGALFLRACGRGFVVMRGSLAMGQALQQALPGYDWFLQLGNPQGDAIASLYLVGYEARRDYLSGLGGRSFVRMRFRHAPAREMFRLLCVQESCDVFFLATNPPDRQVVLDDPQLLKIHLIASLRDWFPEVDEALDTLHRPYHDFPAFDARRALESEPD